jgi:DNA topoisomerase-1
MTNPANAVHDAQAAGLIHVSDEIPGILRSRCEEGFAYVDPAGRTVTDERTLSRIRSLAIPPAWTDVWISPWPDGHLQATGRDAKGRKQYRYHAHWRQVRDAAKFSHVLAFGRALPEIRRRVSADLGRPGLPRRKVLAAVVRLLESTLIRIGNEAYVRENNSFGLTTLTDDHTDIRGDHLWFHFRGKSGKEHRIHLQDARLARIVRRCRDLPGQDLFQYLDEQGQRHTISSTDVNAYLKEIAGFEVTAKDFRTWAATIVAACHFLIQPPPASETEAKHRIADVVKAVAKRLGNTPAVCRASYIHPSVIEAYRHGLLAQRWAVQGPPDPDAPLFTLQAHEEAIVAFLASDATEALPTPA